MIARREVLITRSQGKGGGSSPYADFSNVEHEHTYCLSPENGQTPKRLFEIPEPEKVKSVGCQTDISTSDFEKLEDEVKKPQKKVSRQKHTETRLIYG